MRVRLVTALLAASLVTSACSDDEPAAGPTLPPVTETPSASPTAEAIPTEATAATPEGAEAFVRHFTREVNQAYLTLDAARIQALSDPDCKTCQRYIASIEAFAAEDASVAPYEVEVLEVEAPAVAPETTGITALSVLRIDEVVVTTPDGTELLREAADEMYIQTVSLVRGQAGWLVAEVNA